MLQISEIVRKTEEMFDLFNKHFYHGERTRPAITVSLDGGRGAYGWCSIQEIWNAEGEKYREINLCAEYLDRSIFELAATLLHEMAHLYNLEHDIQDVSNNGYYHNMKFKATAEAHGLHIEPPKYGWTVTTLAPDLSGSLTLVHGLLCDFCPSDQRFAHGLVDSPHPASFRFHLTMDTLAFGYILPATGWIRDLHPLETCAARRTRRKPLWKNSISTGASFLQQKRFIYFLKIRHIHVSAFCSI